MVAGEPVEPANGEAGFRVRLPAALAARFRLVAELPALGAEADLVEVAALGGGDERLLAKLYRRGVQPDSSLLERLSRRQPAHVVRILEHGVSEGTAFEIQEYCLGGSLRSWLSRGPQPRETLVIVLRQLGEAIEAVHGLGILHRDIKPENILLRQQQPLDLALTDFGIASLQAATQHFTSAARTSLYAAPEALTGVLDGKADWWSVGMILLEALLGRHPWAGLSEQVVSHRLATQPVDVSGVGDEAWRALCRGLLRRDPRRRWGGGEVARWLAGDPELRTDRESPDGGAGLSALRPYLIEGAQCFDRVELAAALMAHWQAGGRDLRRGTLLAWVERDLGDHDLARKIRDLQESSGLSDDWRLLRLLQGLDPALRAIWQGRPLLPEALYWAARRVAGARWTGEGDAASSPAPPPPAEGTTGAYGPMADPPTETAPEEGDRRWLESLRTEGVLTWLAEGDVTDRAGIAAVAQGLLGALARYQCTWSKLAENWQKWSAALSATLSSKLSGPGRDEVNFDAVVYGGAARFNPPAWVDTLADLILLEGPGFGATGEPPPGRRVLISRLGAARATLAAECPWYDQWLAAACGGAGADPSPEIAGEMLPPEHFDLPDLLALRDGVPLLEEALRIRRRHQSLARETRQKTTRVELDRLRDLVGEIALAGERLTGLGLFSDVESLDLEEMDGGAGERVRQLGSQLDILLARFHGLAGEVLAAQSSGDALLLGQQVEPLVRLAFRVEDAANQWVTQAAQDGIWATPRRLGIVAMAVAMVVAWFGGHLLPWLLLPLAILLGMRLRQRGRCRQGLKQALDLFARQGARLIGIS